MVDNNDPQFAQPINDNLPSKEEITENPFFEDNSAPLAKNDYNNQQTYQEDQYLPKNAHYFTPQNDYNNINYNNNNYNDDIQNDNQTINDYYEILNRNGQKIIICSIVLFLISIFDIVDLIGEFNPFICVDTAAILIISIIYFYLVCKKKQMNIKILRIITIIICFGGCVLRIYIITQNKSLVPPISVFKYFILGFRTLSLLMLFLFTCNTCEFGQE